MKVSEVENMLNMIADDLNRIEGQRIEILLHIAWMLPKECAVYEGYRRFLGQVYLA